MHFNFYFQSFFFAIPINKNIVKSKEKERREKRKKKKSTNLECDPLLGEVKNAIQRRSSNVHCFLHNYQDIAM